MDAKKPLGAEARKLKAVVAYMSLVVLVLFGLAPTT